MMRSAASAPTRSRRACSPAGMPRPRKAMPSSPPTVDQLAHVRRQLLARLVQRAAGLAGELDLTAGLERDRTPAAPRARWSAPFSSCGSQPKRSASVAEQALDAARARERHRLTGARDRRRASRTRCRSSSRSRGFPARWNSLDELLDALDRHRLRARAEIGHGGADAIRASMPSQGSEAPERGLTLRVAEVSRR